jgi:hypothetical protein
MTRSTKDVQVQTGSNHEAIDTLHRQVEIDYINSSTEEG